LRSYLRFDAVARGGLRLLKRPVLFRKDVRNQRLSSDRRYLARCIDPQMSALLDASGVRRIDSCRYFSRPAAEISAGQQ
jgi:hypothetical protein